jgi:DNA primase
VQPKYLNSPEHSLFEKGRVLYGLSFARADATRDIETGGPGAIVTEGYMDVIALHRAGYTTAVAPLGTALTEAHLAELWRLAPEPVLCFDGDAAGQRAALRALHRALPLLKPGHSLRFVTLPAGEDPDSLIRASGAPAFADLLRTAKPLAVMLWESEVGPSPKKTPEQIADVLTQLDKRLKEIPNRVVQLEYERLFREFAKLRRTRRDYDPRNARRTPHPMLAFQETAVSRHVPPPPAAPGRRQREILIGMLLEHPFLIAEAHEDIAALDFPEPELDRLRRAILETDVLSPGLDGEALRIHLGQNGFATTVDAVGLVLTEHAGFLSRVSGAGVVRLSWTHVLRMVRANSPGGDRSELAGAADALARDLSPEAWERFQALQGREAQEGFSEDEFPPNRAESLSPR